MHTLFTGSYYDSWGGSNFRKKGLKQKIASQKCMALNRK